jgi:penicillin-binding protein 1C
MKNRNFKSIKTIKNIKLFKSKIFKGIFSLLILLPIVFFVFFIFVYRAYDINNMRDYLENSYSVSFLDDRDEILLVHLNEQEQWHIKSLYEIPDNLKKSVLTYEDKNFYSHNGIDFSALLRAFKNNILGRKKSGASTITMQVAKILSPKKRSYYNKIKEIVVSFKIENNIEKEEILSMYLNNAPYGGNIVGYATASHLYFQKKPMDLSWSEAALLAVLPNSPGLINVEKNRDQLKDKRNRLLKRLYEKNYLRKEQCELAMREPLPDKIYPFNRLAPHLGRRLAGITKDKIVKTTIDGNLQERLEQVCKDYSRFIANEGISNIAVLVIENSTYNVKAYMGSQNFLDFENYGQVDGIIAKRSPGSILKPFLYALSIDQGLIAPGSLVPDVPLYFSNFKPQNANKTYRGMVEARQALISSLNIPFVHLLQELGSDKFYYFLKNILEFAENDPNRYGLSIILGTKELSMEDMGMLYAGLANYGRFKKLNYIENNVKDEYTGKKLLSGGASYLTLDTIKALQRPGINNYYKWKNPISWKTGTSYGRRDGWACGVTPEYTVIVWAGNFTGQSNDNISGIISAGRLLFNVFNDISQNNSGFPVPDDLEYITVDKKTGYRLKYEELESEQILFPKSAIALKTSPFYKKIFVNDKGEEIDSRSPDFLDKKEKIVLNYPIEVINYLIRENFKIEDVYNINLKNENSIKILYPTGGLTILLPKDFDGEKEIIFKIANIKKQDIYWYLDNEFVGQDNSYEKELKIPNGEHILTIMAANGEIQRVRFLIKRTD